MKVNARPVLFLMIAGGLLCFTLSFFTCHKDIPSVTVESPGTFKIETVTESRMGGSAFAESIASLGLVRRERAIFSEIIQGNLPDFLRELVPIHFTSTLGDSIYRITIFVTPDYLSIGKDEDHFLIPMTPMLAQRIMDRIDGVLPTAKMVDAIWKAAQLKLEPQPIPPSDAMVDMTVFGQHNRMVQQSRNATLEALPLPTLVAGHKKDVILSNRIAAQPDKVVIYGWHELDGKNIQPVYSGHINWYVDYSHGIRPVLSRCLVNGLEMRIADILRDPILFQLLSDETAQMEITRYDTSVSNYPRDEPIILP